MDGIHDLGGMEGLGSIEIEIDEPVFHASWESVAFRLNLACIGLLRAYNADEYRHGVERMEPRHYLAACYYERVLTAVATLLVEKGVVSHSDLEARAGGRFPIAQPARPNAPNENVEPSGPRFSVGDVVRVRSLYRPGHTRAPGYVRGHVGSIIHVAPAFNYPDASAHGLPGRRESTYHVEFRAADLWPEATGESDFVIVDLWETYLEACK
jgi:nitrile hydratase beta subunit